MEKLTKAEEEIMMIIWEIEPTSVGQIRDHIETHLKLDKPAHSTVSTFLKNLVEKKYIHYKSYGRTFIYFSILSKRTYNKKNLFQFLESYFDSSPKELVSFLIKEKSLSLKDLNELSKISKSNK